MTHPVFSIPITRFGGMSGDLRSRLCGMLAPVPAPGEATSGVWALHRTFRSQEGRINGSHVPEICMGTIDSTQLTRRPMTQITAAEQDRYGGIAWSLLSEFDHFGECQHEMGNRIWFKTWSSYVLPHGTLICPSNPAQALGELMIGYGRSEMNETIPRGVFCVLADEDISNHAKLELAAEIDRLIESLLTHFGPASIPGAPSYRLSTAA